MGSGSNKLRLLGFHGFRTSGAILAQQMEFSRLNKLLEDLVDIVYIDAPNAASGPIPADVPSDIFKGPYYEWWNAQQDPDTKEILRYKGWDESLAFIKDYIALHGPFDGFWAFSQGTILASLLLAMKQQNLILQACAPRFAVCFGGVIAAPIMQHVYPASKIQAHSLHCIGEKDFVRKVKADPWLSAPVPVQSHPPFKCIVCIAGIRPGASVADTLLTKKLQPPSLHIIGSRDYVNKWSHKLMDTFENPTLITHPRGHVIPALEGDSLEKLRSFLMARQQDSAL